MASGEDLDNRFAFHPATTDERREAHETIRAAARAFAEVVNDTVPDSRPRELASALTKIEEAMYWANAGVARQD
ncbi:hypothetical protein [Nocardia asiatica]|jgi:hypothetical protein|uniref:Acb2/Tad1 domain-containing protein n=1 Tax=Nocardia TaxID=1817 RepID=UPI002455C7FC|nr:hypothetical protein [Nocardia asiatica]